MRYEWDFGDGTILADGGPTPTHVYEASGAYPVRLTVFDEQGCSALQVYSGQSTRCPGSAAAVGTTTLASNRAPELKALRVTNRRFAVAGKKRKASSRDARASKEKARRVKRSTTFRYWLSEPARVTFKIRRKVVGRKVGGECKRRTETNRNHKQCVLRYPYVGLVKRAGEQGANRDKFAGKVRNRKGRRIRLSPGVYRATAIARDSQGARSKPRSAWFRVVRR